LSLTRNEFRTRSERLDCEEQIIGRIPFRGRWEIMKQRSTKKIVYEIFNCFKDKGVRVACKLMDSRLAVWLIDPEEKCSGTLCLSS